jgi:hypothetical protein
MSDKRYPTSREDIIAGIESQAQAIERGRVLREKGFGFHWHPIWGHSVSIPSGEDFSDTRLKVRYSMVDNKGELEEANEYLVLCEKFLMKESDASRGYRLAG